MSLFDEFKQNNIDEKVRTSNYRVVIEKEKQKKRAGEEKDEKAARKELSKEMKEKLSPEEFKRRQSREWARRNKEEVAKKSLTRYYERKRQEEEMLEEIWQELYPVPDIRSIDRIYAEKYRDDDMNKEGQNKFYRRCSPLLREKPSRMPAIEYPIRVFNRNLNGTLSHQGLMQKKAYDYIFPHINEITIKDFCISRKQILSKHPMRVAGGKMQELVSNSPVSKNQVCSVASALLRGKYMQSELYLGRVSFLVGDVIITQPGNVIRPCLENNLPHLNVGTVEELHQKRLDYFKRKIKATDVPIYAIRDSYLLKIPINEWETRFYILPT